MTVDLDFVFFDRTAAPVCSARMCMCIAHLQGMSEQGGVLGVAHTHPSGTYLRSVVPSKTSPRLSRCGAAGVCATSSRWGSPVHIVLNSTKALLLNFTMSLYCS